MKRALTTSSVLVALLALPLVFVAGCGSASTDLADAQTQRRFGVRMAKMNLWREATFRFQRATQIEPDNALAHNNLAVAFEATGDFDSAAKEYREALRLDRSNESIQKNYSRFVEFMQRGKKRDAKSATAMDDAASSSAPAVTGTPAPVTPPADVPPPPPIPETNVAHPPQEGVR